MSQSVPAVRFPCSSTGKVLSGRAIANGWPGEDEWFYYYDSEGQLAEITSGAASVWTRK